jgi:plastocyanin domain-containing protein
MCLPIRAAAAILVMAGLVACDMKSSGGAPPAAPGELRVTAGEHGFEPSSLTIPKGAPGSMATVSFVRTTDQTCATEVVFPDLDLKKDLPLNKVVAVDIPGDAARTMTFQCGMGMYKGALLVK